MGVLVAPVLIALACGTRAPAVGTSGPPAPPPLLAGDGASAEHRCTPWSDPADPEATSASTEPPPSTDDDDARGDRHKKPHDPKDVCAVADSNLARAEGAILAAAGAGGPIAAHAAWDRKTAPARLDIVDRRFSLTKRERALLGSNGFVVMERREYSTYAWALHDVYQSQLPIYVSADAILHAVYASNDHLLARIESSLLVPMLGRSLSAMHCALADAASSYPPEVARDLDLYLTVARSLLADVPVPSVLGTDAEAAPLVADARKASGMVTVELFGRPRLVDWSQYEPRGHYAGPTPPAEGAAEPRAEEAHGPPLAAYFRAAMWLSRIEMNLVSRSSRSSSPEPLPDPRETPREAIAAVALADLVERAHAGTDIARLDRAWSLLAGRREDVTVADMAKLREKAGISKIELSAFEKLKTAIGNDFQRTARLHPMPDGSKVLPAITTLLGPRVVADAAAFRPLVNSEVPSRYLVSSGDVAYVLGLDRGKTYLASDLAQFPTLGAQLDVARDIVKNAPDSGDLYGAWLGALRGVSGAPAGVVPSFMTTPAYDDLRVNTLVAGYGQIRHNYVLMAGQSYDEGGCEIPDGWVEPLPAVYAGIAEYASRGLTALGDLDPKDRTGSIAYFSELRRVSRVLGTIAKHELEGRALTDEEKRFLGMVVEMTPGSSGGGPTYTGWYFDIFRGRWEEGLATASFTADYHTSTYVKQVVYAGATAPRMGVFVVDAGGPPRVMVGPVARAYELTGSLDKRLDDESGLAAPDKRDPWAASYTAEAPQAPAFALAASLPYDKKLAKVVIRAGGVALPRVVIDAIDHHSVPVATTTRAIPANGRIVVTMSTSRLPEGIRVRIGDYSWDALSHGPGDGGGVSVCTIEGDGIGEKDWAALGVR